MPDHTSTYLILGAVVFLVLVIAPLRVGVWWLLTSSWKPVLEWTKVVLHFLVGAHLNVLRNFQPRQRLVYELDRKRTSHTGNE